MFENIGNFFKKMMKNEQKELLVDTTSKDAAKERLHIVLMQDRANVSADFLELMKQEIIDVIKKYIVIDEEQIDVRLTNQENEDGTTGAPSLYANIPILNIRNDIKGEVLNQSSVLSNECKIEVPENTVELKFAETVETTDSKFKVSDDIQEIKTDETVNEKVIEINDKISDNIEELDLEYIQTDDLDEEDDEDITFDDLLRAAEEEEKQAQKKLEEKSEKPKTTKASSSTTTKKTTAKKTGKTTKKTTSKSKSKRK